MGRICRVAVAAVVVAGTMIGWQQPALAACHAFTIAVSPASVAEGGTVTVTVERDAGVNPSSVDVSSINETAQAGSDYPAVQRTVSFTTETRQTFTVAVTDDATAEPAETFRLHLSNPGGCPVRPDFELGADARVTIPANDTAPPTTPPPTAPPTTPAGPGTTAASPTSTATTDATTSTAEPSSTTSSSSSTTEPDASDTTFSDERALSADEDDDDGSGTLGAIAAAAAVLCLGAAGYLLYRRRSGPAT